MGLIRRQRAAAVAGGNRRSCTLVDLFSGDGPGGAVPDVGRGVRALTRWSERPRWWREPRVEKAGTRNASGPSDCPQLVLGGTKGTHGGMPAVPEKAKDQGPSWRKPPRQESVGPRNSSGSLTS
jgi:hypothetical protein